jgi:hypothetical protein
MENYRGHRTQEIHLCEDRKQSIQKSCPQQLWQVLCFLWALVHSFGKANQRNQKNNTNESTKKN